MSQTTISRPMSAFVKKDLYHEGNHVFSLKKDTNSKKDQVLISKRNGTNRDACQQSFLISLLIFLGFEFHINKLYKKGKTTLQLYTINSIFYNGECKFNQQMLTDLPSDQKLRRRNIDSITNRIMIDLINQFDICSLSLKKGKTGTKCEEMMRLTKAIVNKREYETDEIYSIGHEVNYQINQLLNSQGAVIMPGDKRFIHHFQQNTKTDCYF